jgi:beta-phosphoglucomutase-like phosphatase (HAD superfamily)
MSRLNPEDYEGIIFDCDGTLTNSMEVHYIAWYETMGSHGIDFTRDRFYALGGMPTSAIIALLASEANLVLDVAAVTVQKENSFLDHLTKVGPNVPVFEIADRLRGKIPMAVASGGYRDSILRQLRHLNCEDWFATIVTAEDTTRHKPHPDVFLTAAQRMTIEPSRCLVFEDADLGIAAAKAAGMDYVDVRTAFA